MVDVLLEKAFSINDSIFLVLLLGLAIGMWWLIRYVFKKNDDRESRYITVIETQAKALQSLDDLQTDVREIKYTLRKGGSH